MPVDYDKTRIAATYDAARGYRPEVLQQWLDLVAAHAPSAPALIVDLGCGTGRFTQPLAERFAAKVIGIDPSERMLAPPARNMAMAAWSFARRQQRNCRWRTAASTWFSCRWCCIICPIARRRRANAIAFCAIKGDYACATARATSSIPQSRFFPGMRPMVDAELPSSEDVVALFEAAGLRSRAHEIVTHTVAASWQEFADKLALRADSFLARLPDSEFEAGLAALRAYASGRAPEAITEEIDFFVFERA